MVKQKQVEYITPSAAQAQDPNKMMNDLVQYTMNFANDSMHTTLCLQYPPKIIAHTCVYMSGQYCKIRPTEGKTWFDVLDVEMEDLACKYSLKMYIAVTCRLRFFCFVCIAVTYLV